MALTFTPHCDYTSAPISAAGNGIKITSITYVDTTGTSNTIWPSDTGAIGVAIDYLNANLQSYWLFANSGGSIRVRLSENEIQSMIYTNMGLSGTVPFTQVGWSCVELPVYAETQWTVQLPNSINEANVKEWAILELVIIGVIIPILTIIILVRKL